jgi:hypothetical protein
MDYSSSDLEALVERVDRLMQSHADLRMQNRRLRRTATTAVLVATVACVLTMLQMAQGGRVEARELVVRDDSGVKRAQLGFDGDQTVLTLFDATGLSRLALAAGARGTHVELRDQSGRLRANLGTLRDGSPSLLYCDEHEKPRSVLVALASGITGLTCFDGARIARTFIGISASATATVGLNNTRGKSQVSLGVRADNSASVSLSGMEGDSKRVRAALSVESDGRPSLGMYDGDGHARARFALAKDGSPGLLLFDAAEKTRSELLLQEQGAPLLEFSDAAGTKRARLTVTPTGQPALVLMDEKHRPAAAMVQYPTGPAITLHESGLQRIMLSGERHLCGIHLSQGDDRVLASLSDADGHVFLKLGNAHNDRGAVLSVRETGSVLQMADEHGATRLGVALDAAGPDFVLRDRDGRDITARAVAIELCRRLAALLSW